MSTERAKAGSSVERLQLQRSTRRVLVADDSETYRSVAVRVLKDAGYEVAGARDGAEALQLLEGRGFDLLITELNLPKLRGLDVLRRVRDNPGLQALCVMIVSDSVSEHLRRVLEDLRMGACLTKNHALRELLYHADALLFPLAAEQRGTTRRLRQLPVNYWIQERLYLQSCYDLSEVGMFLVAPDDEPAKVGTRLSLRFWLPNGDRLVACDAEVQWVNGVGGDLRITHPPGMGLRFTEIRPEDVALIREFVAQVS